MTAQPQPPKPKEFSMSKEERELLTNQSNLKSQHEYLASLIQRDMFIFVHGEIKKRLGIGEDMQITWNVDQGKVFVLPKPEPPKPPESVQQANGQAKTEEKSATPSSN